jgi:2,5-diketo-D-gluconate reductase A
MASSDAARRNHDELFPDHVSTLARTDPELVEVFDFELTDDQMSRIAGLDTGSSLFFDHRDPAVVSRLGNFRLTD